MSLGTFVRWKREKKEAKETAEQEGEEQQESKGVKSYSSRMLSCTRCGSAQETYWMQLRTCEGYRALHCKGCEKQERCARNMCQCGVVWHNCQTHREDPITHSSRKGKKGVIRDSGGQQEKQQEREEASTRTAPVTHQEESRQVRRKLKKKQDKRKQSCLTSHATFILSTQPPKQEILDRIRKRNGPKSQSETIAQTAPHEAMKHGYRSEGIASDEAKDHQATNGIPRKRLRETLVEQVEVAQKRARNAIMVEQRRKRLEHLQLHDGQENPTSCMTQQSKDAAKQAFNKLIKKVETLKK